jgi:hypothetical protein
MGPTNPIIKSMYKVTSRHMARRECLVTSRTMGNYK